MNVQPIKVKRQISFVLTCFAKVNLYVSQDGTDQEVKVDLAMKVTLSTITTFTLNVVKDKQYHIYVDKLLINPMTS
jgi:hypothetical protein